MKKLPLKDVMHSLRIIKKDDGYELRNVAGTAQYDVNGVRDAVNGIPEYFPISIALTEDVEAKKVGQNLPFTVKADELAVFGGPIVADAIAKEVRAREEATLVSEVATIQQTTLQSVLSNSLHNVSANKAGEVAVLLACAVKSAFDALNTVNAEDDKPTIKAEEEVAGALIRAVVRSDDFIQLTDNISLLNNIVHQLQVAVSHASTS